MNRFMGFSDPEGLLRLDGVTGEVVLVTRTGEHRLLSPGAAVVAPGAPPPMVIASAPVRMTPVAPPVAPAPPAAASAPEPAPVAAMAPELVQDLTRELDDLDRELVLTLPYPIARPWLDLLRERDPRLRCKLLVDTFTAILKVWALITASEYLRATDVKDAQVHKTLVRDLARPLISAWNLLLARALPVLRDAKVAPFAPELARAYDTLEAKCRQRFLVSETYVDDAGQTQTRTKKLGKLQALISYRNGLAHGFNQSARQAQRDLDTYLPLLREVLREARFLARYPLWHVQEAPRDAAGALARRLMGARPEDRLERVDAAELDPKLSPLFLRNEATGEVLPLFAFFDVHAVEDGGLPGMGGDVFLFEGNTKGTVIYVSVTGEHAEKTTRFGHWQALLAAKAVDVELLSADTLTLDALRAASRRVSDLALEALVGSGKYLREASVGRPDLDAHLDAFDYGQFGAFILGGESGIGKSTLLARHVEARREAGDVVVFYRASALPSADVAGRMLRDLGLAGLYLEDFHAAADPLFREGGRFLLVVDAVNEFGGDVAELVRTLDQLVAQSATRDWFRVIASVRDGAYQRLPSDARFGHRAAQRCYMVEEDRGGEKVRTPIVALGPVAQGQVEALYEAYRAYRQADPDDPESPGVHRFRPTTAFAELAADGSTRALLRSPLMARLVMEAHHRRALPSDLRTDRAMRLYLDQVVVEAGSPGGGFPERRRLLQALVRELDRAATDALPRDGLTQVSGLRAALLNPQRDSAWVQLVELGVLLEEWEGDTCFARFAFDRLFEFLLAELHDPRVQTADDALSLARRAVGFKSLRGALEAILARACEQGREGLLTTLLDEASGDADPATQALVTDVVTALLVRLAREQDPAFGRVLAAMPASPSEADVAILCAVADTLAYLGEVAAQEVALDALAREADALGTPSAQARAQLRRGLRLQVRGAWDEALTAFRAAESAAEAAPDARTLAEALTGEAVILGRRKDHDGAEQALRRALALQEAAGDRAGVAVSLRRLGNTANARGDKARYEQLQRASLAIAEELGARHLVAPCLNNLGNVASDRGDLTEAERLHHASLALKESLGDLAGISASLWNLGSLDKERGDLAKARRNYTRAVEINRRLGCERDVRVLLSLLGDVARAEKVYDEAETHYREALTIARRLGDLSNVRASLSKLGLLREARRDLTVAKGWYLEALAIDEATGNERGRRLRHRNLGDVARDLMAYDEAETHYGEALTIARRLGDRNAIQLSLTIHGVYAELQGKVSEAERHLEEALTICQETSNHAGAQYKRYLLLTLRAIQGQVPEAEALAAVVEAGEALGTARSRMFAAQARLVSEAMGDGATPEGLSEALEAVRAARAAHGKQPDVEDGPATPLFVAARHLARRGFAVEAGALAREALAEVGDRLWPYRAEAEALGAA